MATWTQERGWRPEQTSASDTDVEDIEEVDGGVDRENIPEVYVGHNYTRWSDGIETLGTETSITYSVILIFHDDVVINTAPTD